MNWDSRLDTLGVKYESTPNAKWGLSSGIYQDENEAQGNHIVLFTVLDADGKPMENVPCVVDWIGRDPTDPPTKVMTDTTGKGNVPIYANLDIHKLNGPYFAFVQDQSKSDVVRGMGLPEHHHVNFVLTFAPKAITVPQPPPPPPPQTVEKAIQSAAVKLVWLPINSDAALYKFAQTKNLGFPQTDEFQVTFANDTYICQVFNLGIVYVKVGDWANVKWVNKP